MNNQPRILILEDTPTDAELTQRELRKAGLFFSARCVATKEDFLRELEDFEPDIILSDYALPQFNGLEALRIVHEHGIQVPFVLITGSLTEEVAVECMKEGADDYILKTSLKRLPSAVLNALKKKETEREKEMAVAALRRSEELYRLLAENTGDLICMVDVDGNFVYVSPSSREILGYEPEELLSRRCSSLLHPDDREAEIVRFGDSLKSKKGYTTEFRCRHRGGEWVVFETKSNWVFDWKGNPSRAVFVSRDITERKRAEARLRESEEQLQQSQKLEAVGQLAGGVAHDFNNLLTVINGYSDLTIRRLTTDDPLRRNLEEIKRAGTSAASLTSQLLAFSRKQVLRLRVLDLNSIVTNMDKMLRRLISEDIELVTVLDPQLGQVKADSGQIEQIVMNLVVNARDAMQQGGKLTLETSNVYLDEKYASSHIDAQPGAYVMIAVSDTGCGMSADVQKRIFEPFFTTKELGKGTGLGLSTVYGIVKQSGGNIRVYSETGTGTTFSIYLPRVDEAAEASSRGDDVEDVPRGWETILVVEDEQMVRDFAASVLREQGYTVLEASNGEEALRLAHEHPEGSIHLLLTDTVMPRTSGPELAKQLKCLRPQVQVLFMSGYTDKDIVHHGVLQEGTQFIQKPFAFEELARKVREVLDSQGASPSTSPVSTEIETMNEYVS